MNAPVRGKSKARKPAGQALIYATIAATLVAGYFVGKFFPEIFPTGAFPETLAVLIVVIFALVFYRTGDWLFGKLGKPLFKTHDNDSKHDDHAA